MAAHELFCDNIFEKFKSLQDSKFFGNIVSDDSSKDSTYFQPRKSRLSLLRRSRPNDDVIEISSSEDEDGSPGLDLQPVINSDWTSNDSVIFINNEDDDDDEMDDGKESCEENSVRSRPVKTTPKYVKKKKKLSKSRKIHTAFNGASYRARKRRTRSHSGKLMTSLSVLHQATLANLMDVAPSYCDSTDDYRTKYEDALYTMSLYSPPPPEELEKSPPRPYSPTDLGDIDSSPEKTNVFNDLHQALMSDEESRSPVYSPIKTSQFVSVNESPMKKVSTLSLSDLDLSNQTTVERTENKGCIKDNKADELKRDTDEVKEEDIQVKMDRNSLKSSFQTEMQSNISEEQLESLISEKSTTGLVFNVTNKIPNSRGPKIGPLHFKRKAIVKLQPLTEREIKRYCFKTICSGKENVPIISDNESFSPPDLGPPIIPGKYSKEDSKSPPNLVRNDQFIDSEESGTPDILETCGSDQNEKRTPVVNGSVNIISTVNYRTRKGTNEKNPPKSGNGDTQAENHSSINRGTQQDGCYRNQEKITRKRKPSPQGQGQKMFRSLSPSKRRVLRPKEAPPSRLRVEMTTRQYGLHTVVNQDAFCSNADDVPEKPREVGGRLLTLQSNRVTGLMEYLSTVACEGLSTIRQILANTDRILPSQTDNQTLMDSITKDHTLRCSVLGDRLVTMVPCKQSPSSASVRSWLEKKELYRQQKMKEKSGKSQKSDSLEKGKQFSDSQENGKSVEFTKIVTLTPAQQRGGDLGINITETPKQRFLTREVSFNETTEIFHVDDDSFSPVKQNGESSMCLENTPPPCQERESDLVFKSHDSDDENIISPSPPQQTISFRRKENVISPSPPKTMIRKEDIISPSPPKTKMIRKEDIISPSPPKTMIRSIRKDSQQLGKSLTSRMRLSQMSSATVAKKQSCDLVQRNLVGSSHSTPVSARDQKSLLEGINVTPISGNVDIEEKVKLNIETSGVFQTPRRVTLPRKQSIEKGDPRRSLMSSAEMREMATPTNSKGNVSQIDGPTPKNSFGFKVSQHNLQDAKALHEVQNLTVLSLELHAETRRDLMPDPEIDPIVAVFYNILNDVSAEDKKCDITGVILVDRKSKESQEALKNKSTTTQPTSPQPSTSHDTGSKVRSSDQPSTSYQRSPSPKPSTSSHPAPSQKGKRSRSRSPSPRPVCKVSKASDIEDTVLQKSGVNEDLEVTYVENEEELFQEILKLFSKWDPDILVGFEIQKFSWGYLLQRASHLSVNLCAQMSRIPDEKRKSSFKAESDEWGADHSSEIHLAGRVILNLWRILRHEVTLNIYTFENIAHHVIHKRVPHYSFQTLNSWFKHRTHLYRWRFIRYYLIRVQSNLKIIDQLDLIGRTSEFARVFGIEFYHVLSRGSQYRVESMMLRLAKPMNFIPASPSVQQRARMRAPECIPLTLEPESRFYADPVVVLDFQSLYPSIMIAYNYCFSTCVGRLDFLETAHEGPIEFGCTHLRISPKTLNRIKNDVTVSPNGVVFVKEHVRKGIISKMVEEILNTRIMVKKSMKEHKDDKGLYRLLDARQMGLKLIANVTYGYTGANFSGRMPCIEVGDSIVRKARETLERAIRLVEDRPEWGARVVYGDTDSMFIEMKGKSKEEAFNIGHEICDAVTAMNPKPIKLKFEKVYYPCVLQTKKRYVGYSYETVDQKEPVFDAKGIETVRRDSCAAVSKILERSIKILFGCKDVSKVKEYVLRQCQKFMEGKVTMQDCIFAKEYRGMKGYKPGACVPALEIAKKLLRHDRQAEPRTGERVPYVIIYGSPGLPLIQLVRQPHEVLADPSLRLNATYYITKQILPPLDRLLSLLGVDVFSWYNDMPKVVRVVPSSLLAPDQKKGTISQYFSATNCPVCDRQTNQAICNICIKDPQNVCVTLCDRIRKWEKIYSDLVKVCNTCMGAQDESQPCVSLDCPIMFRRVLAKQDVQKGTQLREVVNKVLDF